MRWGETTLEVPIEHIAVAHSELAQVQCPSLVVGGIQGSSGALALATTLRVALEGHSGSQPPPSPHDVVRSVAAWGIPDFHTKKELGKVCWEGLLSIKATRSASEVGENAAWVCPQKL